MTFCIAMKVQQGLVGIADTRITSGVEHIKARKVTVQQYDRHAMFLMTSGLRSARDKALTYFEEILEERPEKHDKLYKVVNAFAEQLRRVWAEDALALKEAGLEMNLHTLIGGQLEKDTEHKLYLLYPQANWVEVSEGTPYYMIGESSYGKPLLSRALRYDTGLSRALKLGYLAFESTKTATTDVDFPIDVVLYKKDSYQIVQHRFEQQEMFEISEWWKNRLNQSVEELPGQWLAAAMNKLPPD